MSRPGQQASLGITGQLAQLLGPQLPGPFDLNGPEPARVNVGDVHFALALDVVGGVAAAVVRDGAGLHQPGGQLGVLEQGPHLRLPRVWLRSQPGPDGVKDERVIEHELAGLFGRRGQLVLPQGRLDKQGAHGLKQGPVVRRCLGMVYGQVSRQGVPAAMTAVAFHDPLQKLAQVVFLLAPF